MKNLLAFMFVTLSSWATCTNPYCSAVTPTTAATASIASASLGSQPQTIDIRIPSVTLSGASAFSWVVGPMTVHYLGGVANELFVNCVDTSTACSGNHIDFGTASPTDMRLLYVRTINGSCGTVGNCTFSLTAYSTTTNAVLGVPVTGNITATASGATIQAQGISFGGPGASGSTSYIRWYNTAMTTLPPIGFSGTPTATLGQWEFDASGGSPNDISGLGQNFSGIGSYVNQPIYSPVCPYIPIKSFVVGTPAILDGSNCYALNGGTALTAAWTYQVGADGVNQGVSVVSPTAITTASTNLTAFGSANFQLIVTDTNSQTATVTAHFGAVYTSTNNVINLTAEGVNSIQQFIVGQQAEWGYSPWSFAENRSEASLNLQLCNLLAVGTGYAACGSQFYPPFWRSFAPGTILFTAGSTAVVGSGTTFKATFGGGTTTPVSGANLVWKYTGVPDGKNHYTHQVVTAIADDTHLTIGFPYPSTPFLPWPTCSTTCGGLSYGEYDASSAGNNAWLFTISPGNYYDVVEFAKVNYWRSGSDWFWTLAQTEATYWMEWPVLDYYSNCYGATSNINPGNGSCFSESRSYALTGIILQEQDAGNSYLLAAIETLANLYTDGLNALPLPFLGLNDIRDDAYNLSGVSLAGLVDPSFSTNKWQNTVKTVINGAFTTTFNAHGTAWQLPYAGNGAEYQSPQCTCSIAVTNGSPTITGTGTTWANDMVGFAFWVFSSAPGTIPTSNASGDSQSYIVQSVNSATSITFATNYAGTSGSGKGFLSAGASGIVGWGFQPYMEFHLAQAFYYAAQAMAGFDTPTQTLAKTYGHAAVTAAVQGISPDQGGLFNGVFFPGCPAGMTNTSTGATLYCYGASQLYPGAAPATQSQQRTVSTEAMRAIALDYQNFGTNFSTGTLLMNQMFCATPSLGFSCPGTFDGFFLSDYLDGGTFLTSQQAKWTGELGGYTGGATAFNAPFLLRSIVLGVSALGISGPGIH